MWLSYCGPTLYHETMKPSHHWPFVCWLFKDWPVTSFRWHNVLLARHATYSVIYLVHKNNVKRVLTRFYHDTNSLALLHITRQELKKTKKKQIIATVCVGHKWVMNQLIISCMEFIQQYYFFSANINWIHRKRSIQFEPKTSILPAN